MARKRKPKQNRRLKRWLKRIALVGLGFVILSAALVLPLRWFEPMTTAFMLQDASGVDPLRYEWVRWDDLGDTAALAMVASEDQRFADHFGLDLSAILKAVDEKSERGYLRGGSTISQQTAKNLFLWRGRSFVRKGLEAWLTLVMEACLPKRRILELYLNIAELGPGTYGVGAASHYYFGRAPARMSDREAALLAAVLPNPNQLHVNAPSEYVRDRQSWIVTQIARLRREGWMTRI